MSKNIQMFEGQKVRTLWDEDNEKWWFSVVDVVGVLSGSSQPRKYWSDLKAKLKAEGSELSEILGQLKLEAADGKYYLTDVADTEQILRIIQSIPSKKAEPFKLWLAQVGRERFGESAKVAKEGATAAKVARKQIEKSIGKNAVSKLSAKNLKLISQK